MTVVDLRARRPGRRAAAVCAACGHWQRFVSPVTGMCGYAGTQGSDTDRCGCEEMGG